MKKRQEAERTVRNQQQRDQMRKETEQAKQALLNTKLEEARKKTEERKVARIVSDDL
jgi:hypothetical protein